MFRENSPCYCYSVTLCRLLRYLILMVPFLTNTLKALAAANVTTSVARKPNAAATPSAVSGLIPASLFSSFETSFSPEAKIFALFLVPPSKTAKVMIIAASLIAAALSLNPFSVTVV